MLPCVISRSFRRCLNSDKTFVKTNHFFLLKRDNIDSSSIAQNGVEDKPFFDFWEILSRGLTRGARRGTIPTEKPHRNQGC